MAEDSKIEALEERINKLEQKIDNTEAESENREKNNYNASYGISRRKFLKKAGLGLGGLAALTLPTSALDVRDDSFNVYTTSSEVEALSVDGSQNVSIPNGSLTVSGSISGDLSSNDLDNDAVTVAGNSVSLGGSTGIGHGDLSNISSNDHHSPASGGTNVSVSSQTVSVSPQGSGSGLDADTVDGQHADDLGQTFFSSGDSGDITISSNTTESGMIHADNFTLQSGNKISVDGFLAIICAGTATINGTIDADAAGASGGSAGDSNDDGSDGGRGHFSPHRFGGSGGASAGLSGDGGAGGDGDTGPSKRTEFAESDPHSIVYKTLDDRNLQNVGAGGGGGGGGNTNDDGGSADDGNFPGGGGGGSGDSDNTSGGNGGDGGGAIVIIAREIQGSGTLTAQGQDGDDGNTGDNNTAGGGGGGGNGGIVLLFTDADDFSGGINASGGTGGTGPNNAGDGANGADGIIKRVSI